MGSEEDRRLKIYRKHWCVVWREDGKTKRSSLHTKDRAQAERAFQEHLRQLKYSPVTVSVILDAWAEQKKDLKSIEIAKIKFKPLKAFFGNLRPDHINRELCKEYAKKRGKKNTTIRNELAVLRSAIRWMEPHNKAVFQFPPTDPPKDHYLTRDEYLSLLNAKPSHHIKLFMIVALHTAARATAILELTWDRVNFEKGLINLVTGEHKNKRRALIPMNRTLRETLEAAYRARTCDYVIEYGGNKVGSVRKGFGFTAKKVGLKASPHILRHTAAVVMAEADVPLQEISQFLGHSGSNTTDKVYARYSPSYLAKAASALDLWVRGSL